MSPSVDEIQAMQAIIQIPKHLTAMLQQLEHIAQNTKKDHNHPHIPAVAPAIDGTWGVFCLACTEAVGDYVEVCTHPDGKDMQWPTQVLHEDVNRKALQSLEEVRKIAAGVLLDTRAGDPRQFVAQQIISALE